jgi:hypothetical protein
MRLYARRLGCLALAMVICATLGACTSPPVDFTTQLDHPGGLGPGDPVIHGATEIGSVTGVSQLGDGDSEISFQIEGNRARDVHQDAIMLLNTRPGTPSLEVMNQDAMVSAAAPGSRLDGASDMYQAQLILMSRGPGSLATALANASSSSNTQPPSPAAQQMQQMFSQITQQTTAMAMAIAPPNPSAVANMQSDAQAVERQLTRNGKTDQAARVRQQMNQMQNAYGIKVAPALPSTP